MLLGRVTVAIAVAAACSGLWPWGTIASPEAPSQFCKDFARTLLVEGGTSGTELGGINGL